MKRCICTYRKLRKIFKAKEIKPLSICPIKHK